MLSLAERLEGVRKNDPRSSCFFVLSFLPFFKAAGAGDSKDIRSPLTTFNVEGLCTVGKNVVVVRVLKSNT